MREVVKQLQQGKTVTFKPVGNSMTPRIKSKQEVTVEPYTDQNLKVGGVVLVTVKGNTYLHLISAIDGDRIQISNNHGYVNGWTTKAKVWGVLV
jgi:signal peptidase I